MTSAVTRCVCQIDDQVLCETLSSIGSIFPGAEQSWQLVLAPGIYLSKEEVGDISELSGRYSFVSADANLEISKGKSLKIRYRRRGTSESSGPSASRFDEFTFIFGIDATSWSKNKGEIAKVLAVVGAMKLPHSNVDLKGSEDTLRELIVGFGSAHRAMLAGLNDAIKDVERRRADQEADFYKKEKLREEKHNEAMDEINKKRESLNLQSYRSQRRSTLKSVTERAASDLRKSALPVGAIRSRWAVFFAALLISMVSTFMAYESFHQFSANESFISDAAEKISSMIKFGVSGGGVSGSSDGMSVGGTFGYIESSPKSEDSSNSLSSELSVASLGIIKSDLRDAVNSAFGSTNWFLIGRAIISSIIAVGALVYAAAWMRRFYDDEVFTARQIDRFSYDFVRADWIIETILEVQHEHDGEVPEEWIVGVTRGLFETSKSNLSEDSATQALRALLGFTASASFGPEGPKFDINRKGARNLSKDTQDKE